MAPDLLAFLFGEPFRAGADALRLLLVSQGLFFLHGAISGAFLARHRIELHTRVLGAAATSNLLLNAVLIPRLGIRGSAIAMVVAELVIFAGTLFVIQGWHWRPNFRVLLRPALATTGMCLVLLMLHHIRSVPLRIASSGVTYVALLTLFGALPPQLAGPLQRLSRLAERSAVAVFGQARGDDA